jgi:hypothetical protein
MPTETRSLHRKLAQVMYEVERIPKRGRAPAAMGGFEFVQVGDAADVIRKALAENGVTMIPTAIELISEAESETQSKKLMTTVTVRTTWTITDGDSGEMAVIQSMGSGADTGDKAIPKAQSNAMKYALLMGFLLSTGDDPELTDSSDRQRRTHTGTVEAGHPPRVPEPAHAPPDAEVHREEITGIVSIGTSNQSDGKLRETPTGWMLGFNLTTGPRRWVRVLVRDDMALRLAHGDIELRPSLPLKVFGPVEKAEDHVGDRIVRYQRVTAEKITADEWELPGPPPQTGPGLFDAATEQELDGALR